MEQRLKVWVRARAPTENRDQPKKRTTREWLILWMNGLGESLRVRLVMRQDPDRRPLEEHEWKKRGHDYRVLPPQF